MTTDKLYRLMDILDDLKKIDAVILSHLSHGSDTSDVMLSQYSARRDQLLVYFINELNASDDLEETSQRLSLIKQIMERFFNHPVVKKQDQHLDSLAAVLSA